MAAGNLKLSVILTAITGAFNDNIRAAGQRFRDAMNGLSGDSKNAGSAIEGNLSLGGLVRSVAAVVSISTAIKALADNAVLVQQLQKQLEFATGGGAQAAAAFALVRDVSNSLGVNLEASAKGFAQLAAATKGTQLEGQATKDLFIGISQAAAVLNLSTEETGGVINALSQIASKGTVQLEELKGQLGDRLPGVLKIAADSMGVTVAELNKMVESGLDANVFLSKFGPALQQAFESKAAENLATLGGQINLLKNQFFDLFDTINKAGAGSIFTTIIKDINELLASVSQAFKEAAASPDMAAFGSQLTSAYQTLKEVVAEIVTTIGTLYGVFETVFTAAQGLFSVIESGSASGTEALSPLQAAMLGLNVVVGAIADGFKTIAIAAQLTLGAIAQVSAEVTGTLANAVGVLNKSAGDALMEIAKQRQETMRAAYDRAEKMAQEFKSSTIAALEATGVAAKAAAEATKTSTKDSLLAANNALVELIRTAKEGAKEPLALQARADAVAESFKKLGERGVDMKVVKAALDEITETLGKALPPLQSFLTELKKAGPEAANLHSVSDASAKTVIALADLALSAKTTSFTMREAFSSAISGAKTANEIKLIESALLDAATRGKLTKADIAETMEQIGDASRAVGAKIPEDFRNALAKVSNNFGVTVLEVVSRLNDLATKSDTTSTALREGFENAIKGAKVAADIRVIEEALKSVGVRGKLTEEDIAATMNAVGAKAKEVGGALPKTFEESLVRVGNSFSQMGQTATAVVEGITKSTQAALDRVGVVTKTMLNAAVEQAKADMDKVRTLVNTGELGYDAIAKAQAKVDEATQKATPGIVTMADVTKRLADTNRDAAASAQQFASAQQAAGATQTRWADETTAHNAKVSQSSKDAAAGALAGAQVLNQQFANLRDEMRGISDEAADNWGRQIGVNFGFAADKAKGAQDAIGALREENGKMAQDIVNVSQGGVVQAMYKMQLAANAIKISNLEAAGATNRLALDMATLATDGGASMEELEKAVGDTERGFRGFKGAADMSGLAGSLDAIKGRIEAIKNASLSTAQALHAMGDSFELEILRQKGDEVAVIKAEAAAQQKQIDDQLAALGINASAEAKAQALRATALLAEVTARKIAEQQARDAKDKADDIAAGVKDKADTTASDKAAADAIAAAAASSAAAVAAAAAASNKAAQTFKTVAPATVATPTPTTTTTPATPSTTNVIRFEDKTGKSVELLGADPKDVDVLLDMIARSGGTNITKQGA